MEIEIIAPPTGSGTSEYGIDTVGRLWERGYNERHGRTFGGVYGVTVTRGEWRLACSESHDWRAIADLGASLYYYVEARGRGLDHAEAMAGAL